MIEDNAFRTHGGWNCPSLVQTRRHWLAALVTAAARSPAAHLHSAHARGAVIYAPRVIPSCLRGTALPGAG